MPWRLNNPFSNDKEEPQKEGGKGKPATIVEVKCLGCENQRKSTVINLRIEHKDNGRKRKNCRNCTTTAIEVVVDSGGGIKVYQTVGYYAPVETTYERVWQEGDKA